MATLQILRQENNGIVYADPAKPDMTVRFRNTVAAKTLNGVSVKNYRTEIIYNDNNVVTVGDDVSALDAVSVRLSVSGALESAARVTEILHALADQIQTWDGQNVFKGFNPSSAPVIPAAS
jgi:hypothetical protein